MSYAGRMKVHGDYYRDGYAHLEKLVPAAVAQDFLAQIKSSLENAEVPLEGFMREGVMLKRPALEIYAHQHKPLLTFLYGLTPTMCELTQRELLPTYSYFRVYRAGDVCWVHSDRFACEHSLSLTLAYSDGKPWSFEIGKKRLTHAEPVETTFQEDEYSAIDMGVGDAILYQGVYYRHGRVQPNPNRWSAHIFLHWVDGNGHFKDCAFDGKANTTPVDFQLSA
ncbi:hypothetical protein [Terricaulis sp.]|uniref:hypothetical protein n=1 Tax=Terricaulis sp. TaxID=2768686 RepID=UPI003784EA06